MFANSCVNYLAIDFTIRDAHCLRHCQWWRSLPCRAGVDKIWGTASYILPFAHFIVFCVYVCIVESKLIKYYWFPIKIKKICACFWLIFILSSFCNSAPSGSKAANPGDMLAFLITTFEGQNENNSEFCYSIWYRGEWTLSR